MRVARSTDDVHRALRDLSSEDLSIILYVLRTDAHRMQSGWIHEALNRGVTAVAALTEIWEREGR
jgi:hypothetical protein